MAFVEYNKIKIGDLVKTTEKIESCKGYFEKGTIVTVIGVGERGYDLQDKEGNKIIECGFGCIEKLNK